MKLNFSYDGSLKPLLYALKDTTTRKVDSELLDLVRSNDVTLWWNLGTDYGVKLYDAEIVNHFPCSFGEDGEQYNLLSGKKMSAVEETRLAHHEAFSKYDDYIHALKNIYGEKLYSHVFMVLTFRHKEDIQDARVRVVRKLQQRDKLDKAQKRLVGYMEEKIWD